MSKAVLLRGTIFSRNARLWSESELLREKTEEVSSAPSTCHYDVVSKCVNVSVLQCSS